MPKQQASKIAVPSISLSVLIPILLAISFAIVFGLTLLALRSSLLEDTKQVTSTHVQQMTAQLQREMREFLFEEDARNANSALTSRAVVNEILSLIAVDEKGEIFASLRHEEVGLKAVNQYPMYYDLYSSQSGGNSLVPLINYDDENVAFRAYYPLQLTRDHATLLSPRIGSLFIIYDFKPALRSLNQQILDYAIISGFLLLSLALLMHIFIRKYITRPMLDLGLFADLLAHGKQIELNCSGNKGEVARLTYSLKEMANNLETQAALREAAHAETKFHANNDALTGIPNRRHTIERLEQTIQSARDSLESFSVYFIDMDNFKRVNDDLGHLKGDQLLSFIAGKLLEIVNEHDIVGRLGGDEFLVVRNNVDTHEKVEQFAEKIVQTVRASVDDDFEELHVSVSIGFACFPADGSTASELIKAADLAMYKAKELGKDRYVNYSSEMLAKLERSFIIERELRASINNKEINVAYQGIYDGRSLSLISFEALARWESPTLGVVSPEEFIAVAESSGLIGELTEIVVEKGLTDLLEWRLNTTKRLSIAFNLSPANLRDKNFATYVNQTLNRFSKQGLKGSDICFELTENVLVNSGKVARDILWQLRKLGCELSIDDFGTGYSSINYLRQYPFTSLKIDKSFLDDGCSLQQEQAMIKGIIQLASSIGLNVVAEGVETKQQLLLLQELGCSHLQGFYLSKPQPSSTILQDMETRPNWFFSTSKGANS